jgi:pilus assembly protein CpaE
MLAEKMSLAEGMGVVALVSSNADLHQRLRAAFKNDPRSSFVAIQGDIGSVQSQLDAARGPAVLIADLAGDRDAAIDALARLRAGGYAGAIITISDDLDEPAVRGLLRLSVSDWLPASTPTEEIVNACEQAMSSLKAKTEAERASAANCLTFVPAAGGVGNTTLAIQAAFLMAERDRKHRATCLIDLNFQSGTLADYLDLAPSLDLDAVSATPDRLDARLLEVMLARHESGLAVLAAPRAPTMLREFDETFIARLLGVASEMFANVVIDMPPMWMPWSEPVLGGSDQVFVVTEFTVPALRKARDFVEAVLPALPEEADVRVIVNKCHEQLLGGGLKKRDAQELLGAHLGGFVSEDRALVREAINRGQHLSASRSGNRLARELARAIVPVTRIKTEADR